MRPCAISPDLYSDTVTAVVVPQGCNGTDLVALAASKYDVAFGVGLGEVAGRVFRIDHLGMLTDVMMLAGLAGKAGVRRCCGARVFSRVCGGSGAGGRRIRCVFVRKGSRFRVG